MELSIMVLHFAYAESLKRSAQQSYLYIVWLLTQQAAIFHETSE